MKAIAAKRAERTKPLYAELGVVLRDDSRPQAYRDRRQREIRAQIDLVNQAAERELREVAQKAATAAERKRWTGTPLTAEQIAEAGLLVRQYEGRTRQEQLGLLADLTADLDTGTVAAARAKARAAEILGLPLGQLARAVEDADPVAKAARHELDALEGVAQYALNEPVRELAMSGLASHKEQGRLKEWSAEYRVRPDVPFLAQIEPDYRGPTIEADGFPNAPFPEPHDPALDALREKVARRAPSPEGPDETAERYAARE